MAKAKYATDKDKNKVYMISHTKAIYDPNGQVLEDRLQDMATESSDYTDTKIAALINGAPETLDTLEEVADAIENNETVVDALNSAIGTKANKTDVDTALSDKLDVNGDASDTTVAFTQASTRVNIANGEKQSTLFSKIVKWFADLKTVAFTGSYTDLSNKPTIPSKTSDLTNDSGFKTTDSNTTYSLSKSGSTITLTGSDGSTTSVTDSDTNTTYGVASTSANGLMSTSDKTKLDGIETGANKTTVDTVLSSTSTNPVQNKIINTVLSGKQPTITGGASTITSSNLTSNRALVSNSSGKVSSSTVTNAELGYLSGVTGNIQTQLDNIQNDIENNYLSNNFVSSGFIGMYEVTEYLSDCSRSATIVVGASDSKYYSDQNYYSANYKCTGTADQGQINSAIAALPSSGGKIVLLEGTYNISGSITVNKANVTIEGMGNSTVLQTSSNIKMVNISSSNCKMLNLSALCTASSRCGHGIYTTGSCSTIENVQITHFEHNIYLETGSDFSKIIKCRISDGEGICARSQYSIISNNHIENYDYAGIYLYGSAYCTVSGNMVIDTGFGIFSQNAETQYNKISNNYIIRGTGTTDDYPSNTYTIWLAAGTYNYVSDNYIPGKNYVNDGGATNTFVNNRYN